MDLGHCQLGDRPALLLTYFSLNDRFIGASRPAFEAANCTPLRAPSRGIAALTMIVQVSPTRKSSGSQLFVES